MYDIIFRFKIIAAVFCVLLVSIQGLSQNLRIDSLKSALTKSTGQERVEVLIELARANYYSDPTSSFAYIDEAHSMALNLNNDYLLLRSGRIYAQVLERLERLEEALARFRNMYELFQKQRLSTNEIKNEYSLLLNAYAIALTLVANYDKALELHFSSLVIREDLGNKEDISITLNNIGFVYFKLKNYEKALEYYNRSVLLKKEVSSEYDLDRLYINIGLCYIHLKKFATALESFRSALELCGNNCDDDILMEGDLSIGIANYWLKNYEEAKRHLIDALEFARKNDSKRFQVESLVYLARVELVLKNHTDAKALLDECEKIASEIGYNQLLMDTYREYANLYNQSEDFQNASLYQKKYITLKDSLIGEELVKNIARTQTQFEERENIKTIALKEEALSRQRMLNLAIGTIAFLAALLVFVLYQSNKVKRRVNAKLSDANAIIAEQNKQLQAHSNILQAEVNKATADLLVANQSLDKVNKELDNFIYKTSHDIRGPLASLKGMCNVALIDVKDDLALDYLRKLDVTATKLNRILTRLLIINQINNATLNPEPLDMDGIVDDIIRMETRKGLPAGFTFKREIQRNMSVRSDDPLIRIILENLIDNAVQFYNDSDRIQPFALIKIFTDSTNLNIHVIDNGVGISSVQPDRIFQMFTRASEKSGTGGLGLYLIKQSANRMGGDVGLRLTEHGETEFYVTLPLEIPAELLEKKEDNKLIPPVKV